MSNIHVGHEPHTVELEDSQMHICNRSSIMWCPSFDRYVFTVPDLILTDVLFGSLFMSNLSGLSSHIVINRNLPESNKRKVQRVSFET